MVSSSSALPSSEEDRVVWRTLSAHAHLMLMDDCVHVMMDPLRILSSLRVGNNWNKHCSLARIYQMWSNTEMFSDG